MIDKLKSDIEIFSERVKNHYENINTEEATKTALVMPFIQLMGYDIFNPCEVIPEYTADIGIKNGEKVDYAIMRSNKPVILIECKSSKTKLNVENESQLFRYFHTSEAKFALLTNGIEFKFYTDLDAPNKMDDSPFLEFNILNNDKIRFDELVKLTRSKFNADSIRKSAAYLKHVTAIRNVIEQDLKNPSEEYIRTVFRKTSPAGSMFSDKNKANITSLVKSIMKDVINDIVKENLTDALDIAGIKSESISKATATSNVKNDIETTKEEIEAYAIVKSILNNTIPVDLITMQDYKSYCVIQYGKTNRRPICRLYFNNLENLRIGIIFGKNEEKFLLTSVNDIFAYKEKIIKSVEQYL